LKDDLQKHVLASGDIESWGTFDNAVNALKEIEPVDKVRSRKEPLESDIRQTGFATEYATKRIEAGKAFETLRPLGDREQR
jgi:hypothetical protein